MTTPQPVPVSASATPISTPGAASQALSTPLPAAAPTTTPTASSSATHYAKAKIDQFNEMIRKTQQSARDMHDSVHASCHDRVAARLAAARIQPPTAEEALRYRYHHGVNLGSCFVLEKWLTPSMYPQGADTSELAAVSASCNQFGHITTRNKWEAHWSNMITDLDFEWLKNVAHCTSIRLPIGYWVLGATCTKGTPFQDFVVVYGSAWYFVRKLVTRCRAHGIGVLIDFHGLPGGANGGDHSGTNSGKAELWTSPTNLDLATHCILLLVTELQNLEGIIGLQICNEAMYNTPNIYTWYERTLGAIALIDSTLPIYISDAWNLPTAITYAQAKNTVPLATPHVAFTNPVIVDSHYYWNFADADKLKSPPMVIAEVPSRLSELEGKDGNVVERGAMGAIIGEYSCVMDDRTWTKASEADRQQLIIQFGQAQSKRWQQRAAGSYFWTYKMDWMDGGEWGFVQQTKTLAVTPPQNLVLLIADAQARIGTAQNLRLSKRRSAIDAHVSYWTQREPQKTFEHWRYETGWDVGFADAMAFFGMRANGYFDTVSQTGRKITPGAGGDKIGSVDMWVRKRILDSGMIGPFVWEFETGLRQGIQAFYDAAGV